jgi:DNA-directed RNA polymerase subunit RPC12/RpoP
MRICCTWCGKPVSNQVPEGITIRAVIECPDCVRNRQTLCDKCGAPMEKKSEDKAGVCQQ